MIPCFSVAPLTSDRCSRSRIYQTHDDVKIITKRHSRPPRRRSILWNVIACIGCVVALLQWSVDADEATSLTEHEELKHETLVNLHDLTLEANLGLDLGTEDPAKAARQVMERIGSSIEERLTKLYSKATTPECRAMIGEHFGYFLNAIGMEVSMPFAEVFFEDECEEEKYDFDNLPEGIHLGHIQNRTYQPPDGEYIDDPANLTLCYGILTHDDAAATIRLINALYEEGYVFVVHVDAKETYDETYEKIVEYASSREYVHVLTHPHRVRINWGGFSMVNATMQLLKYAFAIDRPGQSPLDFHKFVHISATSYPIASNNEIRQRIAEYPLDANLMHVIMKPTTPQPQSWQYFVECDDLIHRIYRLPAITEAHGGISMHTSSQWFIISREFAQYLAEAEHGSFVHQFLEYAEHVVVADETFFGTVLRNTQFCSKHHNWNFVHLQFDRWENELDIGKRDEKKCLMPAPDHCGRSPTTMTMDYMDILELTGDLFARKFLDTVDSKIKDVIDMKRSKVEQPPAVSDNVEEQANEPLGIDQNFAGHGVLIVAKETMNEAVPLCMGLGPTQNNVRLVPCFHEWVLPTLSPDWESGAVIEAETTLHNRWEFGPCSTDGSLSRQPNGELTMLPGVYSPTGPRCMLKQVDGLRAGRCLDGESERVQPGGETHVFPCTKRWHQFFSVGNGAIAPKGTLHTTIPLHVVRRIRNSGRDQEAHLCLGVLGRGDLDETEWKEDISDEPAEDEEEEGDEAGEVEREAEEEGAEADQEGREDEGNVTSTDEYDGVSPLTNWEGEQLVTTRCSNVNGVIEWIFVPYIVEDAADDSGDENPVNTGDEDPVNTGDEDPVNTNDTSRGDEEL